MLDVQAVADFLEEFAPSRLAEDWDNVGLLVGSPERTVARVMTCLSVTPKTTAEAVRRKADLVVTHHPLPFQAMRRLTTETIPGRLLLELIAARIAVYSPHTAFDSARAGINHRLAAGLGLRGITPLVPDVEGLGAGRWGWVEHPATLGELAQRVRAFLSLARLRMVGEPARPIHSVAVACGAADTYLDAVQSTGCDCMLTGESRFHTCLEAEASGIALLLPGHYASERFALDALAEVLSSQFPDAEVWASREERDPIRWSVD
jgi:dinuclear metal center YbgI/SA1388 family protein